MSITFFFRYSAIIIFISCSTKSPDKIEPKNNSAINSKIKINTIYTDSSGWGYDIYIDNIIFIHQTHIPAINEKKGFNTAQDANKIAELVVQKINRNQIPPSISLSELDSLAVIK